MEWRLSFIIEFAISDLKKNIDAQFPPASIKKHVSKANATHSPTSKLDLHNRFSSCM